MKEIKDYLHLYLGCEVLINNGLYENKQDTLTYMNNLGDCGGNMHEWQSKDTTLILRPLSSMTEMEANAMLFNHGFSYNWVNCSQVLPYCIHYEFTYTTSKRVRNDSLRFDDLKPIDFYFLLSKHFDLFGLIDSGLAIDARTIKTTV